MKIISAQYLLLSIPFSTAKHGQDRFLVAGLLYTWLTLVGLHVEVAAGGGGGRGG